MNDLASRVGPRLTPDAQRVIAKLFVPGEETVRTHSRASAVIGRILALDEATVVALAENVIGRFRGRHRDLTATFSEHFSVVAHEVPGRRRLSAERRMLIGSCFTHEYAPEAAALCNPSMVAHPDQSGLAEGQLRFLMSVRCIGEGHLSSIGFRTGVVGPGAALRVDEPVPRLVTGSRGSTSYPLAVFVARMADLGHDDETVRLLLGRLPNHFRDDQLDEALGAVHEHTINRHYVQRAIEDVRDIAGATYDVRFAAETELTERLLWPTAAVESHGMEDARFVRHVSHDGSVVFYATYTAYDGAKIGQHLLSTKDFQRFHVSPMAGEAAQNKGLALFPRPIGGRHFALSRYDRESIALTHSDDIRIWKDPQTLHAPTRGWEVLQLGNCGSPVETPDGWLVLTHGVGPMRTYSLGAILLDIDDPSVVLGTLSEPLLTPTEDERSGYVPNVVYSCGPVLHDDVLTIPYGISDGAIGFAQIELASLMDRMRGITATPGRMNGSRRAGIGDSVQP